MEENDLFEFGDRQTKNDLIAPLNFVAAAIANFYSSASALCCTEDAMRFIWNDQRQRKNNDITTSII